MNANNFANNFDEHAFDEQAFALKLRNKLNLSSAALEKTTSDRLFEARQKALARMPESAGQLSLAGFGRSVLSFGGDHAKPMFAALALIAFVFCGDYVTSVQHAAELEEVDSALLADDLPINAYLDRGFDTWLNSSAQR